MCTNLLFENNAVSTDNPLLSGRTEDYSFILPDRIFIVPKEYSLEHTPEKAKSCSASAGFVAVGGSANAADYDKELLKKYEITENDMSELMKDAWYEGFNSYGMSASALFFDIAEYPKKTAGNSGSNATVEIGHLYLVGYVLKNYSCTHDLFNDLKPNADGL